MVYSNRELERLEKLTDKELKRYQEVVVVGGRSLFYWFNKEEIRFPWATATEIVNGEIEILRCQLNRKLKLKIKSKGQTLINHTSPELVSGILAWPGPK